MYEILFTSPAENDLLAITRYISQVLKNPKAADALLNEIENQISTLKKMPFKYPKVNDEYLSSKNLHYVVIKNYIVFYTISEHAQSVKIIRILFGRRDWSSLLTPPGSK